MRLAHAQVPPLERAAVGAGQFGPGPGLIDEDQARRIVRGLALLPHVSAIESVRAVLLAGMACLHPARHRVADEEALDRAMTEVEPASGEQAAQLPDGGNGGLSRYTEDQGTMGFNASGAVVSARRSWTRIALDMCPPAPSADTRRTHAEDRTRSPFRHPLRVTRGPW